MRLLVSEPMLKFGIFLKDGIVKRLTAWLVPVFIFLAVTHCFPWSGKCVGIADGDTIRVMRIQTTRSGSLLQNVHCPECAGDDIITEGNRYTDVSNLKGGTCSGGRSASRPCCPTVTLW